MAPDHGEGPLMCCSRPAFPCCAPRRLTHMDFIRRLPHLLHSNYIQKLGSISGRSKGSLREVRALITQLPPCWIVPGCVLLPKGLALVGFYFLLSLISPFLCPSSLLAVMAFRRCCPNKDSITHCEFPLTSVHTFLNSPFI